MANIFFINNVLKIGYYPKKYSQKQQSIQICLSMQHVQCAVLKLFQMISQRFKPKILRSLSLLDRKLK